jgi:hypothetical protein
MNKENIPLLEEARKEKVLHISNLQAKINEKDVEINSLVVSSEILEKLLHNALNQVVGTQHLIEAR